jgi:hypothetical protein
MTVLHCWTPGELRFVVILSVLLHAGGTEPKGTVVPDDSFTLLDTW